MLKHALIPFVLAGTLSAPAATILHVSPNGADTNPGTAAKPLATLARARDAVRALKTESGLPDGGVVIQLAPGTYRRDAPLELSSADAGTKAAPIVYRAAKRGTARISGGVTLTGWQQVKDPAAEKLVDPAAKGKVLWTEVGADLLEAIPGFANGGCGFKGRKEYPLALYQNDERLPISRWPNEGFVMTGECLGEQIPAGHMGIRYTEGRFVFKNGRLKRWVGEPDLWFDGLWYVPWADSKMRLKRIDLKQQTISLLNPDDSGYGYMPERHFFAFNAIGEIDRPGEWAVDPATRRVYLWPTADPANNPVTVALRTNLIRVDGATHTRFADLAFEHTLETAITIRNSVAVTISGSTIRHTGSWGVDIDSGSGCTVIGCDLSDLGEGGVKARGGDQKTLTPGNHLIENNHIHHFGQFVSTYRPGAAVYGTGNRIRHNLIHHAQHQAVFFNGNDHLIEYNIIHDVCLYTSDAGALYACARDWSQRGVVIRHNFIHSTGKGVDGCGSQGIYLDDYTSGATVVGNICSSVGHAVTTCGNGNRIENNVSINSRKSSFSLSSRGIDSFAKKNAERGMESPLIRKLVSTKKPYSSASWTTRYPHLPSLLRRIESDPIGAHDSHFCTMRNNVNVGGVPAAVRNAAKVTPTGTIEDNINLHEEPGFVDLAGFDLRFRENSRVFKKLPGFKQLEFPKMGLYADARRASPAVKFGKGISPMPEIAPRIPRPELKPRYIMETLSGTPFDADGIAGPKEWPKTRKPQLECVNEIYKAPSKLMCKARVGFDGERVRFLVTVDIKPEAPLKIEGNWGGRDGVELALSEAGEDAAVFLLHVYPDGTFEVASSDAAAAARSKVLTDAIRCGAKIGKGSWTAELAIPVAALGIAPPSFRELRFNMNLHRTCDKTWTCWWTPENGIGDLLSSGLLILPREIPPTDEMARRAKAVKPVADAAKRGELNWRLLKDWAQTANPDRLFPAEQPADGPNVSFSNYSGHAIARRTFKLTAEQLAEPFCALFLPCIDEEGDVFINGALAVSHTAEATGTAPGLLWREPVIVNLKTTGAKPGNVKAAVSLHGNMGTGGLRKGAFLVWGKTTPTAEQLYDFLADNTTLGWRDRVPKFWQDLERERIPPLPLAPDEATFGKHIQRTMNLLASSTPEKRNRVRIFFYGQSITQGMHSREMINVLRTRFPWAIIDVENKAIGGFGASNLVRTGEHDLYPRDADLLIFHVYGDAKSLDTIFSNVRKRNSSEILVYTHHYNWISAPDKLLGRLESLGKSVAEWHELAEKYQMEVAPVYRDWPMFFRKHDWGINESMGDTVHSNVHHNTMGHTLLAKLVLRNFRHHPDGPFTFPKAVAKVDIQGPAATTTGAWQKEGSGLRTSAKGASLKLTFEGNRVDILPLTSNATGTARILIDGKSPVECRELYYCSLPSRGPYIWMPALKRIDLGENVPPQVEDWTLTPFDVDLNKSTLSFKLEGSITGPDGEGSKAADFVSNSGRIKLSKSDFHIIWPCTYKKKDKLPDGYTVTWQVRPLFLDPWHPAANAAPAIERPVTLVQGLSNGPHTLEIIANGDGEIPIKSIIVRRPPLQ
ncbi:MAG: hypothetical protein HN742_13750 [Lentisphaerae bacterium]|nr:hypothetical protein [Lentisphaerota bacterium]MBT5611230.1 hypothetical protein [Lentisphaerota bacterium]MBT7059173.1 hypothetical protein [Lentisphaerota bacterium]MBT7842937.1 hypothetical protein [Lentisphaerota bacterium]